MVIGLVIVSDKGFSGERVDRTGPVMLEYFASKGYSSYFKLIPDVEGIISDVLIEFSDNPEIDIIVTCGGTGCTDTDVTPEATMQVIEKSIPGIPEMIRFESVKYSVYSYLSRGVAGIRNKTVIINLPGSPEASLECFKIIEVLLPHLIDQVINGAKEHTPMQKKNGCSESACKSCC